MNIKAILRNSGLLLMLLLPSVSHSAGLEKQMGNMFNSMVTTTPPMVNVNNTQRGVIGMPGITVKNRISNPNLISFVPPSFEAGCGGIDFYGGSFSFISGAQFQALLRNIASNATGFAFELALGAMCESCLEIMETLQDKIQKLNQFLGNSCQIAQGLVTGDFSAKLDQMRKEYGTEAMSKGVGNVFDFLTGTNSTNPVADAKAGGVTKKCSDDVNLLWCEMKDASITGWFDGGDQELLNTIMALTGSVIIGPAVTAEDGEGDSPELTMVLGNLVTVEQMLTGGSLKIYNCSGSTCLHPVATNTNIKGLNQRIRDMLVGTPSSMGIIEKYATNSGGALSNSEKYFLTNLPNGMGAMVRNLAALEPSAAYEFADAAVPYMALDMLKVIIQDLFESATAASHANKSVFAEDLRTQIMSAKRQVNAELADVRRKNGSQLEIRQFYANVMQTIRHKRYALDLVNLSMQKPTVGEN